MAVRELIDLCRIVQVWLELFSLNQSEGALSVSKCDFELAQHFRQFEKALCIPFCIPRAKKQGQTGLRWPLPFDLPCGESLAGQAFPQRATTIVKS